ncbi:hypothetical protein KJ359_001655 [Pestalotiopsis sp. 9143b]|nr:hypothetical protein KJ359_001655 [Pestalotiopsis sp. 9143b]
MSTDAVSPRHLVLRHGIQAEKPVIPVDLEPGPDIGLINERLHSFDRPGQAPGTYNIDAEPYITKPDPSEGETFEAIPAADSLEFIHTETSKLELDTLKANSEFGKNMAIRMENGYSLTRYRVQTGEVTAAFYRGPLVPTEVAYPLRLGWDAPSMRGADRQIFNQQLGLMDLSYSSAWNLGKTLALSDRSFTVALSRVRRQIQEASVGGAEREGMEKRNLLGTKLSLPEYPFTSNAPSTINVPNRWQGRPKKLTNTSSKSIDRDGDEEKGQDLQHRLNLAAEQISGSLQDATTPYDEFNTPRSADWMVVLKWILDKVYLAGIPAQYMINNPSQLPMEGIWFFAIDRNWTDSLVDGALSLANHLERSDDTIRRAIQHAVKRYFATESSDLGQLPPVPRYGLLLRSVFVKMLPDMVVKTEPPPPEKEPVLIRKHLLDADVIMCLFDRLPSEGSFESISFSQPPHQPWLSAAATLGSKKIDISLKAV